ncbi:MAG TPA: deoxyribose-phosphate aldolase [Planctomycetaceae bacterium]|nr:deoxyribose-phosphate aldolase [Planctomycetaceae bacterium]HRF01206.1 deoxyribose-phosphate aldolase [Pirellulaceae bacterium]
MNDDPRDYREISKMIDHALLVPTLTDAELDEGIRLAIAYDVASVCIMPYRVARCARMLAGSGVVPSTTIGFPHGVQATSTKRAEAVRAIEDGCVELDMVVNLSQVLSGGWDYVADDLRAVIEPAHDAGRLVKVIFENCWLKDEHKIRLCELCGELGADWVKTSTGFGSGGATLDDLKLMRRYSPPEVQVKAAGGVRDYEMLLAVRRLGVSRVGSSKTAQLLDPCRERFGLPKVSLTTAAPKSDY